MLYETSGAHDTHRKMESAAAAENHGKRTPLYGQIIECFPHYTLTFANPESMILLELGEWIKWVLAGLLLTWQQFFLYCG